MNLSVKTALIQFLAFNDPEIAEILDRCDVEPRIETGDLDITCPDDETLRRICEAPLFTDVAARQLRLTRTRLFKRGDPEHLYQFLAGMPTEYASQFLTLEIPPFSLSVPGVEASQPLAVVRMADDKGLYCSNIEAHCRARQNDWLGEDMSRFHLPEELRRLKSALETHGKISEFSYRALAFDFQPIEMAVDATLINYGGDLCRLVRVLRCTPL